MERQYVNVVCKVELMKVKHPWKSKCTRVGLIMYLGTWEIGNGPTKLNCQLSDGHDRPHYEIHPHGGCYLYTFCKSRAVGGYLKIGCSSKFLD